MNYRFVVNNDSEHEQISQPNINNIATGLLLRLPELILNAYNLQRF